MFCCRKICSSSARYTVQDGLSTTVNPPKLSKVTKFDEKTDETPESDIVNNGTTIEPILSSPDQISNDDTDDDDRGATDDYDVPMRRSSVQKRVGVISTTITDVKKEIVKYPKSEK